MVKWLLRIASLAVALLNLTVFPAPGAETAAAGQDYSVTVWRTENGLPGERIHSLTQTTDGYLWIATDAGLVRFNGTGFEALHPGDLPPQLGGVITGLSSDRQGRLWLVTQKGGLGSSKDGKFTVHIPEGTHTGQVPRMAEVAGGHGMVFLTFDGGIMEWDGTGLRQIGRDVSLTTDSVFRVARDSDGTLWIKTVDHLVAAGARGLQVYDRSSLPGGGHTCTGMAREKNGRLWISSERGLASVEQGMMVEQGEPRPFGENIGFTGALPDGGIVVQAGDGFWRFREGVWTAFPHRPPTFGFYLSAGIFAESGSFWYAFSRECLVHWRADGVCATLTSGDGLPAANLSLLYEDREGNLWGAASGVGLVRVRRKVITTLQPRSPGFNGWCTTGCESDGVQWIGTYQSGLECWRNGEWRRFDLSTSGMPASVRSVLRDSEGKIWAGTDSGGLFSGGVAGFQRALPLESPPGAQASALCQDKEGRLWIGNTKGLYLLANGRITEAWSGTLPAQPDIRVLAAGRQGDLWIGTWEKGLFHRSAEGVTGRVGTPEDSVSQITTIYVDGDRVWAGTTTGLHCWYNGRFLKLTTRQGLPDDGISHIMADGQGSLWIGTQRGLLKVDRRQFDLHLEKDPEAIEWAVYDETDGLPARHCSLGNAPAGWRGTEGRLYIATYGGVGVFNPSSAILSANPPVPLIERITVGGREVKSPGSSYQITPDDGRIEIAYDMAAPSAPQKTRFRYRLEGYEDRWVEAGRQRMAAYPNLPAGDYRFRLAACNATGVWAETTGHLRFQVSEPFWKTTWFGAVTITVALGMVAGISRHLATRGMRRRVLALKHRQELDAERARIARDLHDDIGSGLTCISLLCGDNGMEAGEETGRESDLHRIRNIASGMTQTLDEIVWAVSPRHDSLESLATYIAGTAQMLLSAAGIRCRLDFPPTLPPWPLTADERHHLYLAVKEALHNVIKHSGASAARVSLDLEGSGFTLSVADNGRGIGTAPPAGEGLANMKHRLERLGGTCRIENETEGGTIVTFHYHSTGKPPYPLHEN